MKIINTNSVKENWKEWSKEEVNKWIINLKDVWAFPNHDTARPNLNGYRKLSGITILRGADLRGILSPTYLYKVELDGADLRGTNFSGSYLQMVGFNKSNLERASLRGVTGAAFGTVGLAAGVYFTGANLKGADFTGATLREVSFDYADLRGTDFTGADITGADLTGAKWDETTRWPDGFTPPE
jgi:uncharacterized protein YjbI with pentapeptide repeats